MCGYVHTYVTQADWQIGSEGEAYHLREALFSLKLKLKLVDAEDYYVQGNSGKYPIPFSGGKSITKIVNSACVVVGSKSNKRTCNKCYMCNSY